MSKRSWYRVALGGPDRTSSPTVVAAAGEHLGIAVAAAERQAPGRYAIAADVAPESDIPLGESLGKAPVVPLDTLADVPRFHWPIGVLPQLSRAAPAKDARRGWTVRPHAELFVIEAQPDDELVTDLFMGLIERLPQADNLEVRVLDHFEDTGKSDVWLTSRLDAKRILRLLDDHDAELFGNGHLETAVYVRSLKGTLRLTEHKTVVWLAEAGGLEAELPRWLGELGVPRVEGLVTLKDVPHFHYRPQGSRDRKKLGEELYKQRLRRVA